MRIGNNQFTKNHINLDQKISKAIRNGHATQGCLSFPGDGQIAAGSNLLDVFVKQTYKETIKGDEENYESLCEVIKKSLFRECPTETLRFRAYQRYERQVVNSWQAKARGMIGLTKLTKDQQHDMLLAAGMEAGLPMTFSSLQAKPIKNIHGLCPYYDKKKYEALYPSKNSQALKV